MDNGHIRQRAQSVEEADGGGVPGPPTKKGPCFTDNVIGGNHATDPAYHQSPCVLVPAVPPLLQSEPETGVSEPHRPRS